MRFIVWRSLASVLLLVSLVNAQGPQQVTFEAPEVATGLPISETNPETYNGLTQSVILSASDKYALADDYLSQITLHSSSVASTPYAPLLRPSSYTPFLDLLESHLGSTTGRGVRALRKAVGAISGKTKATASSLTSPDWSVRGAISRLGSTITSLIKLSAPSNSDRGVKKLTNEQGETVVVGTAWKHRLANFQHRSATNSGRPRQSLTVDEVTEGLQEVVKLAKEAAETGYAQAWLLLGDLHLTGHLTLKANTTMAIEAFTKASQDHGLAEAQYKLGFIYGSNYGSALGGTAGEGQQGDALLYYTFAGLSGHVPASMTVGYRHWVGIGTKQSCKDALGWYKRAADAAMVTFNAGPPGGRLLPSQKVRLSDLEGGSYGPGASASVKSPSGALNIRTQQEWQDLLEFHHFHAERGDATYQFKLGRLYYQGFGGNGLGGTRGGRGRLQVGVPGLKDNLWEGGRNFRAASQWFLRVTSAVWATDGKEATRDPGTQVRGAPRLMYDATKDPKKSTADDHTAMVGGLAAGYLGRMYLRSEGATANYAKAFLWFSRGASRGDRESNNGLGLMHRDGLGVERDLKKANLYFGAAAQQDLAEAQVNLGKFHFGMGDFVMATTYFEHAIRQDGNRVPDTFQSYYYLAELSARSPNRAEQCLTAVQFYKLVAERGDWDHEVWWEAERAWERGDEHQALLGYWFMAERGYEPAQNNVAWILDRDKQNLRMPLLDVGHADNTSDRLALAYWTRSAAQDNVDALVKMGDYYYKGIGNGAGPNVEKAAACYLSAVNTRTSAMAMWNLGWMHEHGYGVNKDYVMAKRYYDMALENSYDAYFPSILSLLSLYTRAAYDAFFVDANEDDTKAKALFATDPPTTVVGSSSNANHAWSFGQAWRDIQQRWGFEPTPQPAQQGAGAAAPAAGGDAVTAGGQQAPRAAQAGQQAAQAPAAGGAARDDLTDAQRALEANEDPTDWRRGIRNEEQGDNDFFIDDDDDLTGTIAIVGLCVLLGWLLYHQHPHLHLHLQPLHLKNQLQQLQHHQNRRLNPDQRREQQHQVRARKRFKEQGKESESERI
ncbi:BQ2448_422 [Microbotryum intermedium]|uniref:BQ2448_422 protein n=1 Tax=Microbotryum intermedium TaxID=269621 RepID=A0A238F884_9BASI|nr:BQ2448_422 [Microbotryum intermedium]